MHGSRVVIPDPNQVTLEDFDVPAPNAHQVVVRARTTLVSPGTERAFFTAAPNSYAHYPLYPGYSFVGDVVATGKDVGHLQDGDRVVCPAQHASHVVIDAEHCLKVPQKVSDEDAVFFNLIAIAMQGVRKARVELGEGVLVLGAGLIGLFAMQLARLSGGLPVIAVDVDLGRLDLARKVGADYGFPGNESIGDQILSVTHGNGAAVTIEATGASAAVVSAFRLVADGGRVVLLGSSRGETDGVNFYRDVHRKGITIIGGHEISRPKYENRPGWWTQKSEHQVVLDLLAAGRIVVQRLISHRFVWKDFAQAYELLTDPDATSLGMIINWQ